MDTTQQVNAEQIALWNGSSGRAWIDAQELLDEVLRPFEDLLIEAATARNAQRVLDLGCGTGATTLALARHLGATRMAVGLDLSEPMIALAKQRAELEGSRARFICGDAQTYAFEPASFDLLVSRFGVMFFDDPERAFENVRRAAAPDADLRCIVWRSPADNPFMTTAERAAAPFVPEVPARRPDEPGQFGFADPNRVYSILERSGWAELDIAPLDVPCTMPERELQGYIARLGPLGRVLPQVEEPKRSRIIETVRAAFDPFVHGAEVRFTAACWMIGAQAS